MARRLTSMVEANPIKTCSSGPLSIVRFRFYPPALRDNPSALDRLNKVLVAEIQKRGDVLLTSTRLRAKEVLQACIVNYMTGVADIRTMVDEVLDVGDYLLSQLGE